MNRVLIIGPEERTAIKALISKAERNVVPLVEVMRLGKLKGPETIIEANKLGDANQYTIRLPGGFFVTYTHEEQRQCTCRHISISVAGARKNTGPDPTAVKMIIGAFGFVNPLGMLPVWITRFKDRLIVECLEPLDGDVAKLMRKNTQ